MPRSLSIVAREAILASSTGEAFLVLLELSHPQLGQSILVTSDAVATVVGAHVYQPFPFVVSMPAETEDAPPSVQLTIDAIDRSIIQAVRSVSGEPITLTMKVVLASSPATIEAGPYEFKLRDVEYDAFNVSGQLQLDTPFVEPDPPVRFTPSTTPGAF